MGRKEDDLEKLSVMFERKLNKIKQKEEKEKKEMLLALRCWRRTENGEVDQFFFLRENMEKEFARFCNLELSHLDRLCDNVKMFLLSMNKSRKT